MHRPVRHRVRRLLAGLGVLGVATAGLTVAATTGPAVAQADGCTTQAGITTCTFSSSGAADQFVVPAGITLLEVRAVGGAGAAGSAGAGGGGDGGAGGAGAVVTGRLAVTPGQVLTVVVGGSATGATGGFNGGGAAVLGGGGGGASDIRTGADLASRVLVAAGGGGGGAGSSCNSITGFRRVIGGAGGGAGGNGSGAGACPPAGGSAPGLAGGDGGGGLSIVTGGVGVLGAGGPAGQLGGGGGGGLYGGGAGSALIAGTGGGGGSSLVPPGGTVALSADPPSVEIRYAPVVAPQFSPAPTTVLASATTGQCTVAGVPAPPYGVTGYPAPTVSFAPSLSGSFPVGSTTVVATATNGVTTDATASFGVVVTDGEAPVMPLPAGVTSTMTFPYTSAAGAVVTYPAFTATDNCPGVTVARTAGPASGSVFPFGSTTVTHVATDASGNQTVASFTVIVLGEAPSIVVLPAGVSVSTNPGVCFASPVPAPSAVVSGVPTPTAIYSPALTSQFPVGATAVAVTYSNGFAPEDSAVFEVTVRDLQLPTIVAPGSVSVVASSSAGAVVSYATPTASDNCPGVSVARTAGPASGATFPVGTTTVTHVATDAAGNTASADFTVTVTGVAPVFTTRPGAVSLAAAAGQCGVTGVVAPSFAVSGVPTPTVSFSPSLAGVFAVGSTTVTATASNGVQPDATASFEVTVSDLQLPTITAPGSVSVAASSSAGAVVSYATPTASDNCPGVSVARTAGPASGATFPVGTTTVTHVATDAAGNTASASFSVTVTASTPTFQWSGFRSPVKNPPAFNKVDDDSNVRLSFSLGGDFGLGIFSAPPTSQRISCRTGAPVGSPTPLRLSRPLSYDPGSRTYRLTWRTQESFDDTCRVVTLRFTDGSTRTALFKF